MIVSSLHRIIFPYICLVLLAALIVQKMTNGESGIGEYKYNNAKKIMSYAPIERTGWSVGIIVEYFDILSWITSSLYKNILVAAISILASIIVCIIFSKRITAAINIIHFFDSILIILSFFYVY